MGVFVVPHIDVYMWHIRCLDVYCVQLLHMSTASVCLLGLRTLAFFMCSCCCMTICNYASNIYWTLVLQYSTFSFKLKVKWKDSNTFWVHWLFTRRWFKADLYLFWWSCIPDEPMMLFRSLSCCTRHSVRNLTIHCLTAFPQLTFTLCVEGGETSRLDLCGNLQLFSFSLCVQCHATAPNTV